MNFISDADKPKLIAFIAAAVSGALARYGFNLPLEISVIIVNGVLLGVNTYLAKKYNPTGANTTQAKVVMENQTGVESKATQKNNFDV